MPASHSGRSPSPRDDEYFSSIPGINGRVPNAPWGHRRGVPLYDSYRPNYDRDASHNARRSPVNSIVEANRRRSSTAAYERKNHAVAHVARRSHPIFENPAQYLAEAFADRQRELAETAARAAVVQRYSTQPTANFGDRLHHTPRPHETTAHRASSDPSPRIRREYSEEPEAGEIPQPLRESSLFVPQYRYTRNAHRSPEGYAGGTPDIYVQTPKPDRPSEPIPREVPKGCTCAVESACPHKHNALSDCRPLIQENPRWQERRKEFNENYHSEPSSNDNPQQETYAGLVEMATMRKRIHLVAQRSDQSALLSDDFVNIAASLRHFHHNSVTKELLNESRLLDRLTSFLSPGNRPRLRRLDFPIQLIEDLTILLTKWQAGDFSVRAHRGCKYSKKTQQWSIDPDCTYRRKSDYYGHGHLVNGQAWLYRIDMVRDGAHGATRAGIAGSIENGATSIVVSSKKSKGNEYADVDRGEYLEYLSTGLVRGEIDDKPTNIKDPVVHRADRITTNKKGIGPTDNTRKLITSYRTGKPVRVFRGFRLRKIVPLRPNKGFRYDGLYVVTNYELVNEERQIYKFFLERMKEGQGPIRNVWIPTQDRDDDDKKNKKRKRGEAQS